MSKLEDFFLNKEIMKGQNMADRILECVNCSEDVAGGHDS